MYASWLNLLHDFPVDRPVVCAGCTRIALLKINQRLESVGAGSAQGSSAPSSPSVGTSSRLWRNVPPDAAQGLRHGLTAFIIRWECAPYALGSQGCLVFCVCLSGNTGPASASLAYEPSAAKGMYRLLLRAPIFLSPSNRRGGWLSASTAVHVTPCSLGLSVADRSLIYIFLSLPFAWPTRPSSRRRTTNFNGQNPQRSRRRHRLGSFARSRQRGGPDCRKAGAAGPPSVTGLLRRQVN